MNVFWNYDDDGTDDDPNIVFSSVCCLLSSPLFFPVKQSTQHDNDEKDLFVDLGHRVPDVLLEVSIVVIPTLFCRNDV